MNYRNTLKGLGDAPEIIAMKNLRTAQIVAANGFNAVWGLDGIIYYSDSRYRLWKCKSDGSEKEIVYERGMDNAPRGTHFPITEMSNDKTSLAYKYYSKNSPTTIIIDLKNNQYIELKDSILDKITFILEPTMGSTNEE